MITHASLLSCLKEHWSNISWKYQTAVSNNDLALVFRVILDRFEAQIDPSTLPQSDGAVTRQRGLYQLPAGTFLLYQELTQACLHQVTLTANADSVTLKIGGDSQPSLSAYQR
jgi:hypothetical protein